MQPDLQSVENEKRQSDGALSDSASIPEALPPQSAPVIEKKRSKSKLPIIALGVLVFLLFAAFAWVGYWAYTLSTDLATAQQQLSVLQAEHEKLQADYANLTSENEKLNADLTQAQADLKKANTDLANTKADLTISKTRNNELTGKLDNASTLAEILQIWAMSEDPSDVFKINSLIENSRNQELVNQWDTILTDAPSEEAFFGFMQYLIVATYDSLK